MDVELKRKLEAFKREFPNVLRRSTAEDCDWLPALYIRAAYFKDAFTVRSAKDALCGEAYDGGFDAVFANPDLSENEVVIVQSKCYENALRADELESELQKIGKTIGRLNRCEKTRLAERTKEAFDHAVMECEDPDNVYYAIDVVTSWMPNDRQRIRLENIRRKYEDRYKRLNVSRIDLIFGDRLLDGAESWNEEKPFVDHDVFGWYLKDGFLKYQDDSVMLNIRASSLRDVFSKRRKAVLGLNLRYHVKRNKMQKDVDDKIAQTIKCRADQFWYLNNGIMIICRDFRFGKGKRRGTLELFDYSIVNGGQTTYNINEHFSRSNEKDFAVACKIVKVQGNRRGREFAQEIAVSANSQKPIRPASLIANNIEQRRLGTALDDCGVYYVRKDGDRPPCKKYEYCEDIEKIGKLGLAGILLMPMEARNMIQRMFDDPYYKLIFKKGYAPLFRDLIVVRNAYDDFYKRCVRKKIKPKDFLDHGEWRIAAIGLTYVISSYAFCVRTLRNDLAWGKLKVSKDDPRACATICGALSCDVRYLSDMIVDEWWHFWNDFDTLFRKLIRIVYEAYLDCRRESEAEEDCDAFLKRREVFIRYIAPRLRNQCRMKRFKKMILGLCRT